MLQIAVLIRIIFSVMHNQPSIFNKLGIKTFDTPGTGHYF